MGNGESKTWVLLAAGSKGWDNYRHQANVCHAYQIIRRSGIPNKRIVVMMYDDIAYNEENPKKGEIINEPDGRNVYEGVQKDYTGNDVSAENFLAVLRGDSGAVKTRGPKKVLNSGSKGKILIYLSDHGGPGLFAFPNSTLYASDLIDTVTEMSNNQQFSKMLIYVDCCYSGSMLQGLPSSCNVYGISACKPTEVSYMCFFDEWRKTCLAGLFSYWLFQHIKTHDRRSTTLESQFDILKYKIKRFTPCRYGNMKTGQKKLCKFWGNVRAWRKAYDIQVNDAIASHDVHLRIQENRIQRERNPRRKAEHQRKYDELQHTKRKIERVVLEIQQHCSHGSALPSGRSALTSGGSASKSGGSASKSGRSASKSGGSASKSGRSASASGASASKSGGSASKSGRSASASCSRADQHSASMDRAKLVGLKTVMEHFRTSCFDWHDEQFVIALQHTQVLADLIFSGVEENRIMEAITAVSGRQF